MDCSTPGFPVFHYLLKFAQTHVRRVGDVIQPSHPLSSPSPPSFSLSSITVFSNESVLHIRWPKFWSFSLSPSNEYSGLISFKMDWWVLLVCKAVFFFKDIFVEKRNSLWFSSLFATNQVNPKWRWTFPDWPRRLQQGSVVIPGSLSPCSFFELI